MCRSIEKFVNKLGLYPELSSRELSEGRANDLVQDISKRVQLLVRSTEALEEHIRKDFLENDGLLAILFTLYENICSQNGKNINLPTLQIYLKALSDCFLEDKGMMNRIETAGEGPRNTAANMLAQCINRHLPDGSKSLSIVKVKRNVPLVESISSNLNKLSKSMIKGLKGENLKVISETGIAYVFSVDLNKPIESPESFYKNVVDPLWKVLHEGGNFPPEFKKVEILNEINSLRLWEDHEIEHGDINEFNEKRERAQNVVIKYPGEHKMPEDLSLRQLEELKNKILEEVDNFLSNLSEHI